MVAAAALFMAVRSQVALRQDDGVVRKTTDLKSGGRIVNAKSVIHLFYLSKDAPHKL
jgi:hypothetical protein